MRIVLLGQAIVHHPVDWPAELRDLVDGADAVICNFEGCLPPDGSWPMKSKTVHPAHPEALAMLADLGVTHLGLANNHAWDFGHAGMLETRRRAESYGFAVAGAGCTAAEAWRAVDRNGVALIAIDAGPTPDWAIAGTGPGVAAIRVRKVLGLPTGDIAVIREIARETGDTERRERRQAIGYDRPDEADRPLGLHIQPSDERCELWQVDPDDLDRLAAEIAAARDMADKVIVALHYHHWAPDWTSPPMWLDDLVACAAKAKADAVIGSGPPWPFPTRYEGKTFVAPGLGNLVFHTRRAARYDKLGLPVWRGLAVVWENHCWRTVDFPVPRPLDG